MAPTVVRDGSYRRFFFSRDEISRSSRQHRLTRRSNRPRRKGPAAELRR